VQFQPELAAPQRQGALKSARRAVPDAEPRVRQAALASQRHLPEPVWLHSRQELRDESVW
jgi:hypothetical protein